MTEAWMQRGSERQQFLERLNRTIMDELDETHRYHAAQCVFSAALLEFLSEQELGGQTSEPQFHVSLLAHGNRIRMFVREYIWPAVQEFARTPEEALALMADLFHWSSQSVIAAAKQALQTQEIIEPEKVFNGHGAMDEVPLQD